VLERRTILITGAAGNLGSLLSRDLIPTEHELRLMYHRTPLPEDVAHAARVRPVKADLADPATLPAAVSGVDVIVHFAGRLFAARPERFLPETNTRWFGNLLTAALQARVGRIILISFPHVEGPTSVDHPATGRLDRQPISAHCPDPSGRGAPAVRWHAGHRDQPGRSSSGHDLRPRNPDD
jgi:nucleoside-diphosphate-sugar epimerase